MALPTLAKTWQFTVNQQILALGSALIDNQTLQLNIKNALIGFGTQPWTMYYSCSSLVAGAANDGTDRIAAIANIVWGNAGSAHSWWVLQQTNLGTHAQLLFSMEGISASGNVMTLVWSPSAGFTGGSTTARPTATDEIVLLSNAGFGGASALDQSVRWSVMQTTDGQCTRIMIASAAAVSSWAIFDKLSGPTAGWAIPVVAAWNVSVPTTNILATNTLGSAVFKMRNSSISGVGSMTVEGFSTTALPTDTVIGNISNEIDSTFIMMPVGFAGLTSGLRGRHGSFVDLWLGSNSVVSADTYPNTGTNLFAQFGHLILPWNGGAVNLS